LERFAERHGFRRDHVHERTALQSGEHGELIAFSCSSA
jgi:hypothetical protein